MDRSLRFDHLARLTTPTGLYEHARGTQPRTEHGMCVDDVARALVVTSRVPDPAPMVMEMARTYLAFLVDAQRDGGVMCNRRDDAGTWHDAPSNHDHWGRAIWAFGTAAACSPDDGLAATALVAASAAMCARSPHPRATAYAALGAAQVLRAAPGHAAARLMLVDARRALRPATSDPAWPWPYGRLTYANAVPPEAMITVGAALADDVVLRDGLGLLAWLVDEQTVDGHLSLVPAGGRALGDHRPAFDQQPIEVTALAEAVGTALLVTGDDRWMTALERCVSWFEGDNDSGIPVRDPMTGGGFDGLARESVNQNQGAESTLAWLATSQVVLASRVVAVR